MELQGLRTKQLVKAWQTRVEDAEDKNRKYKHKVRNKVKGKGLNYYTTALKYFIQNLY